MEVIQVVLTAEEKEEIKKVAQKEKRSMSSFLLTTALEKIRRGENECTSGEQKS